MNYVKFGNTGMEVSRLCLGAMGFGDPKSGFHEWVLEETESRKVIKKALELEINFFDTANVYSYGASERILGKALNDYANRDEIVVATKLFVTMKKDVPNSGGLSRKEIFHQIDASLERLKMDYVDLYIIHRWDYNTPIEETMEALHDIVKAGKARYIGASSMYAWQFQKAQNIAEQNGWTKFISMQDHLNLIYREEEREMLPYCLSEGISLTPYSPLASGRLTRDLSIQTKRTETDKIARLKYDKTADQDSEIIGRVAQLAERYDVSRVHVALAWLLQKEGVAAPIIGATKLEHVETAVAAVDFKLTQKDISFLEEPYIPHDIVGFS